MHGEHTVFPVALEVPEYTEPNPPLPITSPKS